MIPKDFRKRCSRHIPSRGVHVECINPKNLEVTSCDEPQEEGVEARFSCSPYYRPSGDLPMHYEKCEHGNWLPGAQTQFSCVPDCGVSEAPKTPYVVNGQPTKTGQWPWYLPPFSQSFMTMMLPFPRNDFPNEIESLKINITKV